MNYSPSPEFPCPSVVTGRITVVSADIFVAVRVGGSCG